VTGVVAAQMTETSPYVVPLIAAGSALLGALVGSLASLGAAWIAKRSEERRHLTELAFQAAIEQYKSDKALMLEMAKRQPHESFRQYPLDDYIIGMSKLAQILASNPSDESLGRGLDAMARTLNVARDRYKTMSESSREEASRRVRRGEAP